MEAFRASPRQADLLILSGRVSIKMAPIVRRIYDQMLDPKFAIAMGACSLVDGRLQQLRHRPGRQVPAGRRARPGLPAAPRGADARHPQAALDGPARPGAGLARALRRRAHRRGAARALRAATTRRPRSTSSSPGTPPVPDAPGLELLAQELRDAHADAVLGTEFFRDKGAISVEPARIGDVLELAARQGLHVPGQRPRRRLLPARAAPRASTTSCWTCRRWTA